MRYLTKEWYNMCQSCSFHLGLEEDQQAERFSETYFEQLYDAKLKEWLVLQRQISRMTDIDKETEQFRQAFQWKQEHLKKALPAEIFQHIADPRVFALDKASHAVLELVTGYCTGIKRAADRIILDHQQRCEAEMKKLEGSMAKDIHFHDYIVVAFSQSERRLSIMLDNPSDLVDVRTEMVFHNYSILKQDGELLNAWWLYHELYKVNGGYELHVLFLNRNMETMDFVIQTEHVERIRQTA